MNDTELVGNEMTYLKPRTKHLVLTFIFEMSVIAGIAAIVGTALWYSWNH